LKDIKNAYKDFSFKTKQKRPLDRSKRRWEDNIKKDLNEIERVDVDWMRLAQEKHQWRALVNTVMNLRVL
jgi:hypothetical protein